jgi:hypothetical protein
MEGEMSDLDVMAERPWSAEAVHELQELARRKVPAHVISLKLKRSLSSVQAKLSELGLTVPAL